MKALAYGSLLNQNSLERSLERSAELTPIQISGYRRLFNAPFGPYAFLNLEPQPKSVIEAAYFELAPDELVKFAEREKGSEVVEMTTGIWAFVWPAIYCQELPVLQSYIDVCEVGARNLGIDLWQGTSRPEHIIDDRPSPHYP